MPDVKKQQYYRQNREKRMQYQREYYRKTRHRKQRNEELLAELEPESFVAIKKKRKNYQKDYYQRNRERIRAQRIAKRLRESYCG